MTTYIALLRGINVSGKRMIKMDALARMFEKMGFEKVKTYIQSGNVVFRSEQNPSAIQSKVSTQILEDFGHEVPVLVLSLAEWSDIVSQNPFLNEASKDQTFFHVTLLQDEVNPENLNKIEAFKYLPDEFKIIGKAIYIYCPNGYGNTKLNNSFFENKLKSGATTRNWLTMNYLLQLAGSIDAK